MITIQNQNFGVEIELTGISRPTGAQVIADHFGTGRPSSIGTGYDTYTAKDRKGRIWKCMRDSSITPEVKRGSSIMSSSSDLRCEVVTPILQYEDLEDLQQIVRKLRTAGAIANSSCGIHVHVDGANHTPDSLTRLINFAIGRQDLFYNESLKSLDLSGVITIGQEALSGCLSLKKANLSNRLTGIDAFAFMSTGIDGLTVPGSLIVVPNSSFAASPMRWIVLEQGVKHIDTYSFANCSNLRDLVLPPGLRLISSEAVSSDFHSLEIWIYDPDVEIDPMAFYKFAPDPFPYATLEEAFAEYPPPIIHGYPGSTAEKHARECGFRFVEITETYEETVENVKRLARKRF